MGDDHGDALTRQLLAGADGDRLALSAVVRALYPEVVRYCAVRVAPEVADDVAQEVFLRVTRSAGSFRGDSSARTWVFAVARNTCADAVRRRVRTRDREVVADVEADHTAALDAAHPQPDAGDGLDLALLLDELDPDRREAFTLTQLSGLSYAEAAAVLDVPVGTIRSRVARARGDLVELLERA